MNRGDIVWVEFPAGGGRAQAGRRPAILVQSPALSAALPTVLLVPLTSQQEALRFPGTVLVEPDAANGLRRPSVALVFQLTSVDKRFLGSHVGHVADSVLSILLSVLDEIMDRKTGAE